MDQSDGMAEALEGTLRVAVTAAAQLGSQLARHREQHLSDARGRSEQEGREYAARLHAERAAALAQLTPVYRAEWWDRAGAEDIGRAYTTARAWDDVDQEAWRAEQRIRAEVRTRYGIDVDQAGADPAAVRDYLARAEAMRQQAGQERNAAGDEYVEAQLLMTEAERADRAAEVAREASEPPSTRLERGVLMGEFLGDRGADAAREASEPNETSYEDYERDVLMGEFLGDRGDVARTEVRERYGVDVDNAGAEQARAAAEHEPDPEEHEQDRREANAWDALTAAEQDALLLQQRGVAYGPSAVGLVVVGPDVVAAEKRETTAAGAREDGRTLYDSAERRSATASGLEAKGIDHEVVATRMRADVSQAKPATEAVKAGSAAKSPKARKARGRGAQVHRTGLDR
jgi:hypothetical protein